MIEDADAANAYLHFVHALCEMASWPGWCEERDDSHGGTGAGEKRSG